MTEKLLPLAAMEKVIRKAGADRVAEDAQSALKTVLEDVGHKIAVKAARLANHAGRKTVKKEDIQLAARELG